MTTPARYRALTWFRDHEAEPTAVLMRKRPSTRMRKLMEQDGQVRREAVDQFKFERWLLTDKGAQLLTAREERRKERKGVGNDRGKDGTTTHARHRRGAKARAARAHDDLQHGEEGEVSEEQVHNPEPSRLVRG